MTKIYKCNAKLIKHLTLNWYRCPECGSSYSESGITSRCSTLLIKDSSTSILTETEFKNLPLDERNKYLIRYIVQYWQEYQNTSVWNPLSVKFYSSQRGLHLNVKKLWETIVKNKNVKLAAIHML